PVDSRSFRAARFSIPVRAQFLQQGFRICKEVSDLCGSERCRRTSFLELPLELSHFMLREESPLARPQLFVFEESNSRSTKLFDRMTNRLKHAPDLLVPALMQCDFEPGVIAAFEGHDRARREPLILDVGPATKFIEFTFCRNAGCFHLV